MKVTDDVYELPVLVADSCKELAETLGISPTTISSSIKRYESGERHSSIYRRVEIEEEE